MIDLVNGFLTLISSGGFGSIGINLHGFSLPGDDRVATGVIPTGGFIAVGDPYQKPTVQIVRRDPDEQACVTYVSSLFAYLCAREWNPFGCDDPGRLVPLNLPAGYRDDNGDYVYTLNFYYIERRK